MIRFFSGKPRGGKTKRVMIWLDEILRTTDYAIVTNLAIKMEPWVDAGGRPRKGFLRSLQDKYGKDFDAKRRIVFLSKREEIERFWAIRPRVPRNSWEPVEVLRMPEFRGDFMFDGDKYPSCVFMIDEVHLYFPGAAVDPGKCKVQTPELLGYASQAGRCGDLVFMITQVPNNVNKQLRGVSQECYWMTNHVHLSLGPFRQPNIITYKVFSSTPPGAGEEWLSSGVMKYDKEFIESSYDTAAGANVVGNTSADVGRRARGLPLWTIFLGVLAGGVGVIGLFFGVGRVVKYALLPKQKTAQVESVGTNTVRSVSREEIDALILRRLSSLPRASSNAAGGGQSVFITGYLRIGGVDHVSTNDGRLLRSGDGHLEYVDKSHRYCIIDGQQVPFVDPKKVSAL